MRQRRGQGLVEFALVSILMFTTFCAIVEFSWVFYNLVYLNNAVQKAARKYIADGTASDARIILVSEQGGLTINAGTPVLYDPSFNVTTSKYVGNYVKVTATMAYPSITPLNSLVQMAGFGTLRAECLQRIE